LTVPNNRFEWIESVAASGVTSANIVIPALAPALDTDENDPEMMFVSSLAGAAEAGTIRFTITSPEPMSGPVKINWSAF
jgi:hypothetical protein